jgi:hypothetical protein
VKNNFDCVINRKWNNILYYICYEGSDIGSSIDKINSYDEKVFDFEKKGIIRFTSKA